jgi:hypothetical protein
MLDADLTYWVIADEAVQCGPGRGRVYDDNQKLLRPRVDDSISE